MKNKISLLLYLFIIGAGFLIPNLWGSAGAQSKNSQIPQKAEDAKPLKIGDKVPSVTLRNADGLEIPLDKIIKNQPTVLIFYRGGWCVYCNKHFGQLKSVETPLSQLGYQIVAISPDRVEKLRESLKKHKINYLLLSDSNAEAMKKFNLAFRLDDATYSRYKNQYSIDIEKDSGQTHHLLPVPTAYVIDQKGIIRYRYTNPNYKERVDPQELLRQASLVLKK